MNILKDEAGAVKQEHILSRGFTVYHTEVVYDIDSSCHLPQFTNGEFKITGGYWNYVIKNSQDEELFSGWWNSNEEFDETLKSIGAL
jgi:hypothetical protein